MGFWFWVKQIYIIKKLHIIWIQVKVYYHVGFDNILMNMCAAMKKVVDMVNTWKNYEVYLGF